MCVCQSKEPQPADGLGWKNDFDQENGLRCMGGRMVGWLLPAIAFEVYSVTGLLEPRTWA